MPIVAAVAYIFGKEGSSDFMSFHWFSAAFASALYSLAVMRAGKVKGIWSARVYSFEVLFPFVWTAVCTFIGMMPIYTIFVFLTLPVALGCSTTFTKAASTESDIARDLADRTATLQTMFTVVLSAVLLIF